MLESGDGKLRKSPVCSKVDESASRSRSVVRRFLPPTTAVIFGGIAVGFFYFPVIDDGGWRELAFIAAAGISAAAVFVIIVEWHGPLSGWKAAITAAAAGAMAGTAFWLATKPDIPVWLMALGGAGLLLTAALFEGALSSQSSFTDPE